MNPAAALLTMNGIVKSFPGVKALCGVNLSLAAGEVLALLGENGAGKSTLMKVLGGAHVADQGTIAMEGKAIRLQSPHDSRLAKIAVIYQEFNLIPGLTAVENIFLGQETTHAGFIELTKERRLAGHLFRRLGVDMDLDVPCRTMTTAQQQLVEIAKALAFDARIIVMDEPSAALTSHEVERLFEIIRDLKKQGIGIIYISHRLDEITAIADRVSILRDGRNVGERPIAQITRQQIIEMMVGRELSDEFPKRQSHIGAPRFEVKGLCRGQKVRNISFQLRRGEILGMAGLVGAGRTETMRLIFGADARDAGDIFLDGKQLHIRSPRDAIRAGIGLLTEDRKLQGLVLSHSVRENFSLPNLDRLSRYGFVRLKPEHDEFSSYVKLLDIRLSNPEQRAMHLSGGNQQKVVLAKWLARNCEVLIFDEPTRGIDAGAKYEIYRLMNKLAERGKAILMISSELPELIGMSDRILVMHDGRITGELADARQSTQEQVMQLAVL